MMERCITSVSKVYQKASATSRTIPRFVSSEPACTFVLLSVFPPMPPKYSKKAQCDVGKELHEYKRGGAHSGPAKRPVRSRTQAITLSKARKAGAKVPKAPRKR